jgi:hypothetical protein
MKFAHIKPRDRVEAERIDAVLTDFDRNALPLEGIADPQRRSVFLGQFMESIHRIKYISRGILTRDISPQRADPNCDLFDPLKAAAIHARNGEHDEACWMTFLFTHFGKNLRTGYRLVRDIYGSMGSGLIWTWGRISTDPETFRGWLNDSVNALRSDGIERHFGNHRKYVSLDPFAPGGTGQAIVTYVQWVSPYQSHRRLFADALHNAGNDPRRAFDYLYRSMDAVASFGRTGKVDYLCMLAKLDLAEIEPGSTYMSGATGPLTGARLLFGRHAVGATPRQLDKWLVNLEAALGVEMGMQILEDALCNWQKSPDAFVAFRG